MYCDQSTKELNDVIFISLNISLFTSGIRP